MKHKLESAIVGSVVIIIVVSMFFMPNTTWEKHYNLKVVEGLYYHGELQPVYKVINLVEFYNGTQILNNTNELEFTINVTDLILNPNVTGIMIISYMQWKQGLARTFLNVSFVDYENITGGVTWTYPLRCQASYVMHYNYTFRY